MRIKRSVVTKLLLDLYLYWYIIHKYLVCRLNVKFKRTRFQCPSSIVLFGFVLCYQNILTRGTRASHVSACALAHPHILMGRILFANAPYSIFGLRLISAYSTRTPKCQTRLGLHSCSPSALSD